MKIIIFCTEVEGGEEGAGFKREAVAATMVCITL